MNFLKVFITPILLLLIGYAEQNKSPNFVFIITDDISPDDLEPYGNTFVKTPHLKAMAESGLVFENAYNTISSCSPSLEQPPILSSPPLSAYSTLRRLPCSFQVLAEG